MVLFRYCDDKGILTLTSLTLKVTPPNEFDDPFEFSPIVRIEDRERYAEAAVDEMLSSPKFFDQHRADFPSQQTFSDFQAFAAGKRDLLKQKIIDEGPRVDGGFQQEVQTILSKSLGVVCFTEKSDNLLMWALYAAKHTGIVIEFDATHDLFASSSDFIKVDYNTLRAAYDPAVRSRAAVETLAARKSPDWSYQEEWRLMVDLGCTVKKVFGGTTIYLLNIPHALIKSVILGLRASPDVEREVRTALRDARFQHVRLQRMTMSGDTFQLIPIVLSL